jgi:hypothetical protein
MARKSRNRHDVTTLPGTGNPIGNAGSFSLGGGAGAAGDILKGLGTRLQARSMASSQARAMLEATKITAAAGLAQREMELQAEAEAQQREHEVVIKTTRMNNTHAIRKTRIEAEQSRLNQTQSTVHTHGILDRMVTDFPDSDLTFETERGQNIRITRPKGASSEDSEGGRLL